MASVVYGGIPLELVRTDGIEQEPVKDQSGTDYLWANVTAAFHCVWSEAATSQVVNGVPQRLGVSIRNLQQLLLQPRQLFLYSLGPDEVFRSPLTLPAGNQGFAQAPCDAAVGPVPLACRVTEVHGARAALVYFRIRFAVYRGANVVLSNRWRTDAIVDEDFFTTRITQGRAVLRKDLLIMNVQTVDQFRGAFVVPVPREFKRERVHVQQNEAGTELAYTVVDRQQALSLGANSSATRVEGSVTAGVDSPIKSVTDALAAAGRVVGSPFEGGPLNPLLTAVRNTVPVPRAHCHVCAWGNNADPNIRHNLTSLVIRIALDRLAPLGGIFEGANSPKIVQAALSQSVHVPYVELRAEFYIGLRAFLNAVRHPLDFSPFMNMSSDVIPGGDHPDMLGRGGLNPPPPNSNGTRGSWVGKLVGQLLADPGTVPVVPPQAEVDAPTLNLDAQ